MVVVAADDCCVGDSILWKDKAWLRTNNLLIRYLSCGGVWWGATTFFLNKMKKSMRKQKVPSDVFQIFGGRGLMKLVGRHGEISR